MYAGWCNVCTGMCDVWQIPLCKPPSKNMCTDVIDEWLTCEGLEGCQVVAIQHVHVPGERQVLTEAATQPRVWSAALHVQLSMNHASSVV